MAEEQKPKQVRVLAPTRVQLTEHANTNFTVTVEEGTAPDDVLDPAYWAHIAARMSPYDEIRIRTDDGIWFARALVSSCGRNWARVKLLELHQLTSADIEMTATDTLETHVVRYRGPLHKFSVIRKSDNAVLKEGMLKDEASRWLAEHLKTVG